MRVAAIQYRPHHGDPERSREELAHLVDDVVRRGAQLVVCPEMAVTGYVWRSRDEILPHAELADGPTASILGRLARRHGAWVVCGIAERAKDDRLHNAAVVIDGNGELACTYRKATLFEADRTWAAEGDGYVVVNTPLGRIAPGICMDLNDDAFVRHLRTSRADVLAFCTNWLDQQHGVLGYWAQRLRPWNGLVVASNRWGVERGVAFRGESAIFRPMQIVYARGGRRADQVLVADVPG